jgi:hypothetical protein
VAKIGVKIWSQKEVLPYSLSRYLGKKKEKKKNNNSASIILNVHLSFLLCE